MTYTVELSATAWKQLAAIDRITQARIRERPEALAENPHPPGAKKLQGREGTEWRIRIGDYRAVYTVENGRLYVLVVRIGNRREVYR